MKNIILSQIQVDKLIELIDEQIEVESGIISDEGNPEIRDIHSEARQELREIKLQLRSC